MENLNHENLVNSVKDNGTGIHEGDVLHSGATKNIHIHNTEGKTTTRKSFQWFKTKDKIIIFIILFVTFSAFIGLRAEYDSRIGNALVFSEKALNNADIYVLDLAMQDIYRKNKLDDNPDKIGFNKEVEYYLKKYIDPLNQAKKKNLALVNEMFGMLHGQRQNLLKMNARLQKRRNIFLGKMREYTLKSME
ncbi:MAG: hypothetical protein L3J43_02415 [Sulfurovum sp.]|nr:hypothetical protein [Sulfurovum sp.]